MKPIEKRFCDKCDKLLPINEFIKNGRCLLTCVKCRKRNNYIQKKRIGYFEEPEWKTEKRICPVCKKEFYPAVKNQLRCSKECTKKFLSFEFQANNETNAPRWYKLRFETFKRDNFTCQYCGRNVKEDKIKLHCDHIVPKKEGGKYILDNLTTACKECNIGKGDVLLIYKIIKKQKMVK